MAPLIAFYGDDFTGATDTLATAALAGLRTLLFLRVPTAGTLAAAGPLDCLGIAGTARSLAPADMERELAPVAAFFKTLGAPVIHYKTCSTFDSAPAIGSIGHAAAILRPLAPNPFLPIVGGQPNLQRYCLFGNLFAAAGIGGAVHRIDRHPTMSVHPVTPMGEADLRLHLARQGLISIRLLPYTAYAQSDDALDAEIAAVLAQRPDAVLLDVARDEDLPAIGRLLWRRAANGPMLAIGPSSVADALARGRTASVTATPPTHIAPASGPVLVLAGSLSPVTRQQVQAASSFAPVEIDAARLIQGASAALATVTGLLAQGRHVLVHTTGPAAATPAAPARDVAQACGTFLRQLLPAARLRRIGIAGGDTSSYAVKALDIWGLSHLGQLGSGAALCRAHADLPYLDGVELMLKGGQMGPPDIFERLVRGT